MKQDAGTALSAGFTADPVMPGQAAGIKPHACCGHLWFKTHMRSLACAGMALGRDAPSAWAKRAAVRVFFKARFICSYDYQSYAIHTLLFVLLQTARADAAQATIAVTPARCSVRRELRQDRALGSLCPQISCRRRCGERRGAESRAQRASLPAPRKPTITG